jgi:hypothetical protein
MGHLSTFWSPATALPVLGGCLIFGIAFQLLKLLFSPLRGVPGPFWARFSRLWYLHKVYNGDFEKTNIQLHEKYGTALNLIFLSHGWSGES